MAAIEKRTNQHGKVTFRVKVRLKGFPQQSATFERLTDARQWVQQTEAAIREGRYFRTAEAKKHTLNEAINRYLKRVAPNKRSAKDCLRHLCWWKTEIGDYTLADLNKTLISECRDKLADGITSRGQRRSNATVNRYMAAISHVFTIAFEEWGWVDESPFRRISALKEPRGRVRYLDEKEIEHLLRECRAHSEQLYTLVVLAISTGARRNELLTLTWKQIDLNRGLIYLERTKNDERRQLSLTGHALELVKRHPRHIDTQLVFPSPTNPSKPIAIQNIFESALNRAGIENFRFHDLRHTCASHLAMNGASLAEIAEVLGHRTLEMTRRYTHLCEGHISNVVTTMNKKVFGVQS